MKPFIIITGPQAVGKMAVGMALREKYSYRLFHNHMTIEMVKDIYGVLNKETWSLVGDMREVIFDNAVTQDLPGFIFTYVWAFDMDSDNKSVYELIKKFEDHDWDVTIVELEADVETRLGRNRTELRLKEKSTKRDIEWSDSELLNTMEKYRLISNEGEIVHPSYIRINNENLEPEEVAEQIYNYINK